jgi:tripartite-type tricarboxylate transporter receptor subunit TctC
VPTLREQGVAEYELSAWFATYFPAQTPADIVAATREIIRKATKTRYVTEVLTTFALEPLELSGDELTALQRTDSARWGKVVRSANLKLQ